MVNDQDFNTLRLIRSKNIGNKTFYKLIQIFKTPKKALANLGNYSKKYPLMPCPIEEIENEIENCQKIGAEIITIYDNNYPYLLKQIDDPPPVLTILGNKSLLNSDIIAIVGARNASANGYNFASKIAREIGQEGFTIVSGLARGIDTASHKNSLETGTIAVIAGGIDNIYPQENEGLYYEIAKKGVIISELPFGTAPMSRHFPARNRIISGLSKGIIIIEASLRSGTLITANRALEQGRDVFVAPGNPYDPRCEGSNKLLKEGAVLLTNVEDVINSINHFKVQTKIQRDYIKSQQETKKENQDLFDDKVEDLFKSRDEKTEKEFVIEEKKPKDLKALILSKLNECPIAIEDLKNQLDINMVEMNRLLTELELDEKISVEYGKVKLTLKINN